LDITYTAIKVHYSNWWTVTLISLLGFLDLYLNVFCDYWHC
jgi:hypothetical protein